MPQSHLQSAGKGPAQIQKKPGRQAVSGLVLSGTRPATNCSNITTNPNLPPSSAPTASPTLAADSKGNTRSILQRIHLNQRVKLARQLAALGPLPADLVLQATNVPDLGDPRSVMEHGDPSDGLLLACVMAETLNMASRNFVENLIDEDTEAPRPPPGE